MRVAVLEDDTSQLELLSHWLKLAGHNVQGFQRSLLLLKALVRERFDALLLDWNVSDLSGIEVLRRVRQSSTVPVLLISGEAGARSLRDGLTSVRLPIPSIRFVRISGLPLAACSFSDHAARVRAVSASGLVRICGSRPCRP